MRKGQGKGQRVKIRAAASTPPLGGNFSQLPTSKSLAYNSTSLCLLAVILFVVTSLGCHRAGTPQSKLAIIQTDYESERAAIVSAVIREMYVDDRTQLLVIEHEDPCPPAEPNESPDPEVTHMRQQMEDHAFQNLPNLSREND
jgi:hypothetical protein